MKKILILFLILLFFATVLSAETINLEQVRSLALVNSRTLAKYNLNIKSAELEEKSRVYSNLPSLSLGASASMSLWSAQNNEPVKNPFDTFSAGASVSVSQRIFEGGKTIYQKAINEIAIESARKDALAEYFAVLDSADTAYYEVLRAESTLEAEESALQSSMASLEIAEIRYSGGMINQGDYLKALADKETRENSRNQARRSLSLSITKLKAITGLSGIPELEQIDFSGYEELILHLGTVSDEEIDTMYEKFWQIISQANPSIVKSALAKTRAEKNLSLTKSAYSPSLSASFSTGLNYTLDRGLEYSGGRISLSASIPVDYWVMSNNTEKSKISRDIAALDYISMEISLDTELQTDLLNGFSFAGTVISSRRSLDYNEKHFEYVMERYRMSQSSVSELNDAATLLITSRNSLINARFNFLQNLSKLRSLGAIDDEEKLINLLMGR